MAVVVVSDGGVTVKDDRMDLHHHDGPIHYSRVYLPVRWDEWGGAGNGLGVRT